LQERPRATERARRDRREAPMPLILHIKDSQHGTYNTSFRVEGTYKTVFWIEGTYCEGCGITGAAARDGEFVAAEREAPMPIPPIWHT